MPTFDAGSIEGKLDLDLNPFNVALDEALRRGEEFDGKEFKAKLGLDTQTFKTELDAMKAKLDEFKASAASATAKVNVDRKDFNELLFDLKLFSLMTYTATARVNTEGTLELEALKARLAELHDRDITVRVNTRDTGGADPASASGSMGRMQTIILAVIMLLPVLASALGAALAIAGALGSALVIAGAGFAAFAIVAMPAMTQIQKALSATGKGIQSLPPYLRDAATAFKGLKDEIKALQQAGGAEVAEALAATFRMLTTLLKTLSPVIVATAQAIEDMMIKFNAFFKSPTWVGFVSFLSREMGPTVGMLTDGFIALISSVMNLTQAFWNLGGSKIMGMIVQALQDFNTWTSKLAKDKYFQLFMDTITRDIGPVMGFLGQLLNLIIRLVVDLSPLGNVILGVVNALLNFVNSLPPGLLGPVALGIAAIVMAVSGFGGPIAAGIVAVMALASGLAFLYDNVKPVRDALDAFGKMISDWFTPLWHTLQQEWTQYVVPAWDKLMERFKDPAVQGFIDTMGGMLKDKVLPAIGDLAQTIVKDVIPAIIGFLDAAAPFVGWFVGLIAQNLVQDFINLIYGINGAFKTVVDIINVISDILRGDWGKMWKDAGQALIDLGSIIAGAFGVDSGTYSKSVNDFLDQTAKNWDEDFGPNGKVTGTVNKFLTDSGKNWDDQFGPQGKISTTLNSFNTTTNGMFDDLFANIKQKWEGAFGSQGGVSTSLNSFNTTTNGMFDDLFKNIGVKTDDFLKTSGDNWNGYFGDKGSISTALNSFNTTTNGMFADFFNGIDTEFQTRIDDFMKSPAHAFFVKFGEDSAANWEKDFGPNGIISTQLNNFNTTTNGMFADLFANVMGKTDTFTKDSASNWDGDFGPQGSVSSTLNSFNTTTNGMFADLFANIKSKTDPFIADSAANWDHDFGPNGVISTQLNNFNTTTNGMFADLFTKIKAQTDPFMQQTSANWDHDFGPNGVISTQLNNFNTTTNGMFNDMFTKIGARAGQFFTDSGKNWDGYFGPNGSISTQLNNFNKSTNSMFNDLFTTVGKRTNQFVVDTGNSLKEIGNAFRIPINWVIDTAMNKGIINAFNTAMAWLGQPDRIGNIPLVPAFATGGPIPDTATSIRGKDSVLINAMPGEFVLSTQDVANMGGIQGVENMRQSIKGFAAGGPVPAAGATPPNPGLGGILGFFNGAIGNILKFIGIPGAKQPVELAEGAALKVGAGAVKAITQKVEAAIAAAVAAAAAAFNIIGGAISGGGAGRWAGLVAQVLAELGQPASLVPGVIRRIQFESGGNPTAINLTDSNAKAGHPSQGLMQTIPSTFAAYAGPYVGAGITDPHANIYAGLNYALHRYGSIAAIDPINRPMGYDSGGMLKPGITMAINHTGKPERILDAHQTQKFDAAMSGGGAGASNDDVVGKLDEVKSLLEKNGAGASVIINDVSGNPEETGRSAILHLRLG